MTQDKKSLEDKNQKEEDTALLDRIYDEIDALVDDMETYNEEEAKIYMSQAMAYMLNGWCGIFNIK